MNEQDSFKSTNKQNERNAISLCPSDGVSKLDKQTFKCEFDSRWVSHSYNHVPYLSKKRSKLL